MTKKLYRITVTNWSNKNSGHRSTYKKTMIDNNFCTDNKLGMLPLSHRWLFLGIILECGSHSRDTIEMNERQLRALLESSKSIVRALDALQSFQLLTYTLVDFSLFNRIELKEMNRSSNQTSSAPQISGKQNLENFETNFNAGFLDFKKALVQEINWRPHQEKYLPQIFNYWSTKSSIEQFWKFYKDLSSTYAAKVQKKEETPYRAGQKIISAIMFESEIISQEKK